MSVASPDSGSRSRLRLGLLVAAVVVVVAVVLTVVLTRNDSESGGGGPGGPATTATSVKTGAPSAGGSQSGAPSAEPSSTPTTEVPSPSRPPATATGAPFLDQRGAWLMFLGVRARCYVSASIVGIDILLVERTVG